MASNHLFINHLHFGSPDMAVASIVLVKIEINRTKLRNNLSGLILKHENLFILSHSTGIRLTNLPKLCIDIKNPKKISLRIYFCEFSFVAIL